MRKRHIPLVVLVAGLVCSVGAWLTDWICARRVGVPMDTYMMEKNDRFYVVGRCFTPVPCILEEISEEKYSSRLACQSVGRTLLFIGVVSSMAGGTGIIVQGLVRRWRQQRV